MPTPTTYADLAPVAPATLHVALDLGNTSGPYVTTQVPASTTNSAFP